MKTVVRILAGECMGIGERHTVPAFVVGFGFMRAWALTFLSDSGVTPPLSLQISSDMFLVFAPLIILTMVVVMAVVSKRDDVRVLSPKAVALTAAVLTAGTCLLVGNGAATSVAAEAICAVGFGAFLLQWGIVSSRIARRETHALFEPGVRLRRAVLLPPVSAASLCGERVLRRVRPLVGLGTVRGRSARGQGKGGSPLEDGAQATHAQTQQSADKRPSGFLRKRPAQKTGTLVRLFVAMFLMELVARSSLMLSGEFFTSVLSYPSSSFELARLCGTFLASTLFIVVAKCSKEPLRTLYLVVPALLVCSCLFLLFENWGIPFVTYAIAFAAGAWLETVFWIFFSHSHRSVGFPAIIVWGSGRIAFWLSTFVGLMFWSYQAHIAGGIVANENATITLTLVMALLSMVVYLFVLPERSVKALGIIGGEAPRADTYHAPDQVFSDIAKEFGLSKRETEVFCLLAKGRDTAYIQEKLFISSGTVCSHRDRIYRKLGIHSKQELLDLVENRLGDPT